MSTSRGGRDKAGDALIEQYCDYAHPSHWHMHYRRGKVQIQLDPARKLCIVRSGISTLARLGRCGKSAWLAYTRLRTDGPYYMVLRYPHGSYLTYPGFGKHGSPLAGWRLDWKLRPDKYDVFNVPNLP